MKSLMIGIEIQCHRVNLVDHGEIIENIDPCYLSATYANGKNLMAVAYKSLNGQEGKTLRIGRCAQHDSAF